MTYFRSDSRGYFGDYGGAFVPEILAAEIDRLAREFDAIRDDAGFWAEYARILADFSCRPTPLTFAENLTRRYGTARIYLKREDLNQTGSHKLNNVVGQGLLAKRLGKKRVIAETGAGQHGVATATMAAKLGLECVIYMGAKDVARQRPNVFWMEKLGARVVSVTDGNQTLKDSVNAAFKDWTWSFADTHYVLGTACGPHPFPEMVARFQAIIGQEAAAQIAAREPNPPKAVYACVGGGSNATGIFSGFADSSGTELVAVEAGGRGSDMGDHASRIAGGAGVPGITQGYKTYFLQDSDGQLADTHSVAAGLDYVGISPILADLADRGRARFESATDEEVMTAHALLMREEGIIAALESTHAFARMVAEIGRYSPDDNVIVNISGRGDKDIFTIADAYGDPSWQEFLAEKAGLSHPANHAE